MTTYSLQSYSINEALVASREVLELAKGRRLPGTLAGALSHLKTTRELLSTVSISREQEDDPLGSGPSEGLLGPMGAVRKSLSGLATVLRGHAHLPAGHPVGDKARRAYVCLYPNDTTFLGGSAVDLDVLGSQLVERAQEKSIAKVLGELGCKPHMVAAREAVADLVAAVKANKRSVADAPTEASALDALQAVVAALRDYAFLVQSAAAVEGNTLDRELLAPLVNRRVPKRARAAPAPETTETEDAADEAPPSRAA